MRISRDEMSMRKYRELKKNKQTVIWVVKYFYAFACMSCEEIDARDNLHSHSTGMKLKITVWQDQRDSKQNCDNVI